jgi:hypothetical protein
MKRAVGLAIPLLAANLLAMTGDPAPASREITASCAEVNTAARTLFQERGFTTSPDSACPQCLTLTTKHLHDPRGHSLWNVRTVMHRYMRLSQEKDVWGAWYAHTQLKTDGKLRLNPTPQGCRAQLLFEYGWYAAEFLVIVPVDGDPASRPSNLKLETEYLDAIAQQIAADQTAAQQ